MADCRDWRIITALMTQLKTMTAANEYNTIVNKVFIPKKKLKIEVEDYPVLLVFYNETTLDEEGHIKEVSTLDVILLYIDGLDDNDTDESYVERLKNVGADIRMCLQKNTALGGLCEYIKITGSQPVILPSKDGDIEAHMSKLEIQRTLNMKDPYK